MSTTPGQAVLCRSRRSKVLAGIGDDGAVVRSGSRKHSVGADDDQDTVFSQAYVLVPSRTLGPAGASFTKNRATRGEAVKQPWMAGRAAARLVTQSC